MADLAGLDIGWHRDPSRVETLRDALCAAGRFGQKNGKGFYDYDEKYRPFVWLALGLVLVELGLRNTVYRSFI